MYNYLARHNYPVESTHIYVIINVIYYGVIYNNYSNYNNNINNSSNNNK